MKELEGLDPTLPTYPETYEVMSDIARMHQAEADALRENPHYLRFLGTTGGTSTVQRPQMNTNAVLNTTYSYPRTTRR